MILHNTAVPEEAKTFSGGNGDISVQNDDDDDDGTDDETVELDLADSWKLLLLKRPADGEIWDFTAPDGLKAFFDEWGYCFKRTVGKRKAIYCTAALLNCEEGDIDRMTHLRDAVTTIVQRHPFLLWKSRTRHDDDSPLWLAIKQKEATMVMAFMEGLKRSNRRQALELKTLLKQPVDPERRSMLQWAIEKNLEEDAIQAMLAHVSDDTLLVQDMNGRTALHAALAYGDCTTDRVRTVQQMILQSSSALGVVDKLGRSIYAYHLWTQKQWLERKRFLEEKAEKEEKIKLSNKYPDRDLSDIDPKSASKIALAQTALDKNIDPKRALSQQPDFKNEITKGSLDNQTDMNYGKSSLQADKTLRSNQGFRREPLPEPTPIIRRTSKLQDQPERIPSSINEKDERKIAEQKRKAQSRRRRNAEENAQAAEKNQKRKDEQEKAKAREEAKRHPTVLEANSQTVRLEIKLRCMRTLSPKETARILYGRNSEERQICFDFPGRPTVRLEAFRMSFQSVKFDEVLQYVAFPSVRFEKKTSDEEVSSKDGLGRKEMIDIFEWLRKAKKVKRIVKVIVNDFEKPAHSDRAIVESLKGFRVEELQWLKTDLDPETILNVSDDIRKLRLRWSGSNTALRAWSDPYGLRKLQHLDTIQLELEGDEVLESYDDTRENIIKFETRMNLPPDTKIDENKLSEGDISTPRKITVKVPAMTTFGRSAARIALADIDTNHMHIENHKWLETMDSFRDEMIPVWKEAQKRAIKDSSKELFAQPITVALIDDGVDVLEPSLQGKLIDGKTLSYDLPLGNEPTEQREHAFWESSGGHGTVMANMIFRVCPMARLYVIRMETHIDGENRSRITAHSAAEAINAAVDKGVNIISMSWTISQSEDSKDSGLQQAIDRAHEKNILMFASSSDGGHFRDDSWPISLKRDAFFRIGAAKADGKPFDWAGPVNLLDYTFPGVDVIKAHGRSQRKSGSKYHDKLERMPTETGSSVATALAAGTAAMVLMCVRIAAIDSLENKRGVTQSVLNEMQKRNNMAVALERLGVKLGDNRFIEVWQTLDTRDWPSFKEKRPAAKMEMVAAKTIPLIPSQVMGT